MRGREESERGLRRRVEAAEAESAATSAELKRVNGHVGCLRLELKEEETRYRLTIALPSPLSL